MISISHNCLSAPDPWSFFLFFMASESVSSLHAKSRIVKSQRKISKNSTELYPGQKSVQIFLMQLRDSERRYKAVGHRARAKFSTFQQGYLNLYLQESARSCLVTLFGKSKRPTFLVHFS